MAVDAEGAASTGGVRRIMQDSALPWAIVLLGTLVFMRLKLNLLAVALPVMACWHLGLPGAARSADEAEDEQLSHSSSAARDTPKKPGNDSGEASSRDRSRAPGADFPWQREGAEGKPEDDFDDDFGFAGEFSAGASERNPRSRGASEADPYGLDFWKEDLPPPASQGDHRQGGGLDSSSSSKEGLRRRNAAANKGPLEDDDFSTGLDLIADPLLDEPGLDGPGDPWNAQNKAMFGDDFRIQDDLGDLMDPFGSSFGSGRGKGKGKGKEKGEKGKGKGKGKGKSKEGRFKGDDAGSFDGGRPPRPEHYGEKGKSDQDDRSSQRGRGAPQQDPAPRTELDEILEEALEEEGGPLRPEDFDDGAKRFLTELMQRDRAKGTRRAVDAMDMLFESTRHKERDSVRRWPAYIFTLLSNFDPAVMAELNEREMERRFKERERHGARKSRGDAPRPGDIDEAWKFVPDSGDGSTTQLLDRWGKPVLV